MMVSLVSCEIIETGGEEYLLLCVAEANADSHDHDYDHADEVCGGKRCARGKGSGRRHVESFEGKRFVFLMVVRLWLLGMMEMSWILQM